MGITTGVRKWILPTPMTYVDRNRERELENELKRVRFLSAGWRRLARKALGLDRMDRAARANAERELAIVKRRLSRLEGMNANQTAG